MVWIAIGLFLLLYCPQLLPRPIRERLEAHQRRKVGEE